MITKQPERVNRVKSNAEDPNPDWSQLYVKFMHEKEMFKQFLI